MIENFVYLSFYCFSIKPIVLTVLAFSRDLNNYYCMSTMQLLQLKLDKEKLIYIFIPIKQYKLLTGNILLINH